MVNLKTLLRSKEYYGGTNEYGGLDIERPMTADNFGHQGTSTTMRASVALALTERCCKLGIGKVYYLGNPFSRRGGLADARKHKLAQLPDLLYQLHVWSKDEQEAWFKTSHYDRYCLLNAQAEWISPPGDPILEIELVDEVTVTGGSRVVGGGFETVDIEANRPSPFVFVHALQGAFFGSRADITGGEEYRQKRFESTHGYLYHDGTRRTWFVRTIDDPIFQEFRQFDGDMAAQTLKDTYLQGAKTHQNIFSSWDALASKMIAIWRETAE